MGLLSLVLLCSYCLLGSANQASTDEADCDEHNVFLAADEVLRTFNEAKEAGNQFVLYRITEANKKEEGGQVHIFIKFKIQESVCQVKNGIYWQRCAFKVNEADYGECSAHVLVNLESKSGDIINQNCSLTKGGGPKVPKERVLEPIVTVDNHPCLGCSYAIDTNSELLVPIMKSAIEKMNRVGNHQFHFDLESLTNAEQQVVSGWNYKLEYKIRQTNCSKSLFPKWTPEECSLDKNGQGGQCTTSVFVTPNEEIRDIQLKCLSSTGFCLSCPHEVEQNDPALLNLLEKFMEEYNSHSNHTNLYKVQNVETASRKLVQNQKQYQVMFIIQETNCSKSEDSILGEECSIEPLSKNLSCEANIHVAKEIVNILPDYTCDSSASRGSRIVIKGLSPLRIMPTLARSQRRISLLSEKSKQKGKEPDHKEQKHGRGKKEKNDKKDKKGKKHNGKHDHSSEESAEEDIKKPPRPTQKVVPQVPEIDTSVLVTTTQQANPTHADGVHGPLTQPPTPFIPNISHSLPFTPAPPKQQGTYPNVHETVKESSITCPGKLWQPLSPILQITTDKPFIIEGLTFDDDDLLP